MSFRFQKRVKIAPGIRLNLSKRGISTSLGTRGASVTVGKRGIYGNAGIPGSGLSYRTRLDSKGRRKSPAPSRNRSAPSVQQKVSIQVEWDEVKKDLVFFTEDGRELTPNEEKQVRKTYKAELISKYEEKASEINEQTERLLDLHHEIFQKDEDLTELAKKSVSTVHLEAPDEKNIYDELFNSRKNSLSLFEKAKLLIPKNSKAFREDVRRQASGIYNEELSEYREALADIKEEVEHRNSLAEKALAGEINAMERWIELFLDELDFPLETEVDFQITSSEVVYVDIDLPTLDEVPMKKAKVLKSGRLKIKDKTQREHREHYALLVGGTALYLASFFFKYLPTLKFVYISGYNQILDTSTGHETDQYIYSLKIDKPTLYSFNMENVHPIDAFEHFEPRIKATKTYIFKEISPYEPAE